MTSHIDPGASPTQIGSDLYDLHLIRSTIAFDMYTRLTDAGPKFQAGAFVLNSNMSLSQIVTALQHGRPDEKTITFPEGFPLRNQAQLVDDKKLGGTLTGAEYLKAAKDPSLRTGYSFLPAQTPNADFPYEGYLFPDTYLVDPAVGAKGLVEAQLDQFATVFGADWQQLIAQSTPARPKEDMRTIVILASMVDREANNKTASDRGNVCSVYYNRLRLGIPLGVDATLLYALGRLTPQPTAPELDMNTPYNTRKHAGLPPGPAEPVHLVVAVHHRGDRIELRRERLQSRCGRGFPRRVRPGDRQSVLVLRHGLEDLDGSLEALELGSPSLLEPDAVHDPGELRRHSRHEHLAGSRPRAQAGRHVQGHSTEAALNRNSIAGVHADADG